MGLLSRVVGHGDEALRLRSADINAPRVAVDAQLGVQVVELVTEHRGGPEVHVHGP